MYRRSSRLTAKNYPSTSDTCRPTVSTRFGKDYGYSSSESDPAAAVRKRACPRSGAPKRGASDGEMAEAIDPEIVGRQAGREERATQGKGSKFRYAGRLGQD